MLVYPVLVLALGALWPLDWTHSRLDSLSPVAGQYHSTTWAMAEKVTGGDDTGEEVVVVEGTTSDEVGKKKESPKGWRGWFHKWLSGWSIVDENGNFQWDWQLVVMDLVIIGPLFIFGLVTAGPVAIVILVLYFLGKKFYMFMKDNCCGSATKNLRAKTLD